MSPEDRDCAYLSALYDGDSRRAQVIARAPIPEGLAEGRPPERAAIIDRRTAPHQAPQGRPTMDRTIGTLRDSARLIEAVTREFALEDPSLPAEFFPHTWRRP